MRSLLERSIRGVERWVEEHNYKGYEPFDGLLSPLRPLAFGNLLLERLLMQAIRQSPINLRPMFGVRPVESTKGRGCMAAGYLTMLTTTGESQYEQKAKDCLAWLIEHRSTRYSNFCWANHFDFVSRGGRYTKDDPIIVWTALIGQAFLDAYDVLKAEKYLAVAQSICEWMLELPRQKTESGWCLSYLAFKESYIHNANMLGAAMLARTGKLTGNSHYMELAREAMKYSCSRQLANGGWYYAEEPKYHWIDNFHTGYNLDSLRCYRDSTNDRTYDHNLSRGFEYFRTHFFEESGAPRYYSDRTYPIDIQCAAQAIETLAKFSDYHKSSLDLGLTVAKWTIDNMQAREGCFYYRRYPLVTAKTPMLHWGQATMYKGLTLLLSRVAA
jgi:hypothetical protein